MSHLQKLNCRCEVTAVKFICNGKFLLTAQGPFLSIYNSNKGSYIDSYQLLSSNKIHGIRTHKISFNNIKFIILICFGGRELSISVFNTNTKTILNVLTSPLLLSDWIFDTKLLIKENNNNNNDNNNYTQTFELAIGMMHSQVLIYSLSFNFDDDKKQNESQLTLLYQYIDTILNENTSILYSLSFHGSNRQNLMIAAGDCFNHVKFIISFSS